MKDDIQAYTRPDVTQLHAEIAQIGVRLYGDNWRHRLERSANAPLEQWSEIRCRGTLASMKKQLANTKK